MKIFCDCRYLVFPVSRTACTKRLEFRENGRLLMEMDAALDNIAPDQWMPLPTDLLYGREIDIRVFPDMPLQIGKAETKNAPFSTYLRPAFHFSAAQGWLNDPNGMTWYNGRYHLFYQYNPLGCSWGNMSWGHAESTDLLHWEEKAPALYPDELGMMYSGSAVVDFDNRTGLQAGSEPPLLLYYTAQGGSTHWSAGKLPTQCLAYSTDGGGTFTKYDKNPVVAEITDQTRDPKVIYHAPTGRYIMALYKTGAEYMLLASADLLHWEPLQTIEIPEEWECPDFYPLPLDGDPAREKWVLIGASDRYLVGSFDGYRFTPEQEVRRLHHGNGSYAAQSFFQAAPQDPRRIRIAWNNAAVPAGAAFQGFMNIPCEMSLRQLDGAMQLCAQPVEEVVRLRCDTVPFSAPPLDAGGSFRQPLASTAQDICIEGVPGDDCRLLLSFCGIEMTADFSEGTLSWKQYTAPLTCRGGKFRLRVLLDTASAEVFLDEGQAILVCGALPDANLLYWEAQVLGGQLHSLSGVASSLASIW